MQLPASWNGDARFPGNGWATYHLSVALPTGTASSRTVLALKVNKILTAFRLWVDGSEVCSNGTVGTDPETSLPGDRPGVVFFAPPADRVDLTVQVSNFAYRKGGIPEAMVLGLPQELRAEWDRSGYLNLFLAGGLVIMGLYHMVLWFLRRSDAAPLLFGMFSFIILLRVLLTGDQLLVQWLPGFSWEVARRLEFLPLALGQVCFIYFIRALFPQVGGRKFFRPLVIIGTALTATVLVLPVVLSNKLLVILQGNLMVNLAWILWVVIKARKMGLPGANLVLAGSLVLTATISNDILWANQLIPTTQVTPLGFFVFMILQSVILAIKFTNSHQRAERLFVELETANQSFRRFVPYQFLEFLDRKNIADVALGDQIQREMTVLFADIRSFTTLSESMTPRENFTFLNSYLKRMGPIIRKHGGFIDKFLGDGMMALFPGQLEEALDAAIAMYRQLNDYNQDRRKSGYPDLSIGIALNRDTLILGTIGEYDRMDTTVIADAVNVASRLESLCKSYGPGIILPEKLLSHLSDPRRYHWRRLDRIRVRGREKAFSIIQIYDGQPEAVFQSLEHTRGLWEEGMDAYRRIELPLALKRFEECLDHTRDDMAANLMVQRIRGILDMGVPNDWSPLMDWSVDRGPRCRNLCLENKPGGACSPSGQSPAPLHSAPHT